MATKGVELASAYISLSVETSKIGPEIKSAFGDAEKYATDAGKKIGQKVSAGAGSTMGPGLSKELATQLATAGDKGSKELLRSLAAGHRQAERDAAVAGRNYAKALASGMSGGGQDTAKKFEAEFRSALGRQNSSKQFLDAFEADSRARGAQIGTVVGTVIGRSIGGAVKLAMVAAAGLTTAGAAGLVGGLGYVLNKGFQRLEGIDSAKFKLQALGHSTGETKQILDEALGSVKGTAFSFDQAASSAASAVAAGIKPGEQLKQYLKDIADAAAIAGTSFDDMGHIFNKIQTQNKAYTDDLQMLSDRGVPIFQWLQQEYGVTGDALSKMVQDGDVDAQHFQHAIETHISGAALKMGESFSGAVENAKAALARLGAAILDPVFSQGAGGLGGLTDGIDKLTKFVNEHRPEMVQFFTDLGVAAVSFAQDVIRSFGQTTKAVGDFSHAAGTVLDVFGSDKGPQLQALGDSLNSIGDKLISTAGGFDTAKDKIRDWGAEAKTAAENMEGAHGAVSGVATALGALPFKKSIDVTVNTADADAKIQSIADKLNGLSGTVDAPGAAGHPIPLFDGGTFDPYKGLVTGPLAGERGLVTGPFAGSNGLVTGPFVSGSGGSGGQPGSSAPGQNPLGVFAPSGHPGPPQTGGGGNSLPASAPAGLTGNKALAYQAMIQHGWGPDQWPALDTLIMHESGYSPSAHNPSGAHGIGQFMPYTWSTVGGSFTNDPGTQLEYMMRYLKQRYGSPSAAWGQYFNHAGGEGSYASGGGVNGPGGPRGDQIPAMLSDNEHVFTSDDVDAMGGQAEVYAFRNGLHRSGGGSIQWLDFIQGNVDTSGLVPGGPAGQRPKNIHWGGRRPSPGGWIPEDPPWKKWPGGPPMMPQPGGSNPDKPPVWFVPPNFMPGGTRDPNRIHRGNRRGIGGLGFAGGGDVKPLMVPWGVDPHGGKDGGPSAGPFRPWWDMDWMPPEHPEKVGPGEGWWWNHGPTKVKGMPPGGAPWAPPIGKLRPPLPGDFYPGMIPDREIKGWGFADGGQVNVQDLLAMLADPNNTQHGQAQGAAPGPGPQGPQQPGTVGRTEGYIPAGAGGHGQAGTSFASGLYQMAGDAINNLIDQAASMASSAAGMGVNAIAPGAGGAASGAAGAAMGIGTDIAKKAVSYGFQEAGIWTDAIAEILLPFGVPRFFQTDVSQFIPQLPGQPTAVTTGEKGQLQQPAEPGSPASGQGLGPPPGPALQPGGPVQPGQLAGQQPVGAPVSKAQPGGPALGAPPKPVGAVSPWFAPKTAPNPMGPTAGPAPAPAPAPHPQTPPAPRPAAPAGPPTPHPMMGPPSPKPPVGGFAGDLLKNFGIFDEGGLLEPGDLALNASRKAEPMAVFNNDQWGTLNNLASTKAELHPASGGTHNYFNDTWHVTVKDVDELQRKTKDRQTLNMMRYAGRPSMGGA